MSNPTAAHLTPGDLKDPMRVAKAVNQYDEIVQKVKTSVSDGTGIGSGVITNAKLANMAAWTIKVNNSNASAAPQDLTIDALTAKASPTSSDELVIWDAAASAMKKATIGSLPAAASSGTLVSGQLLTTSATVTIPTGAHEAHIWLLGGTGGSGGIDANAGSASGGTGGPGYVEHVYTGLTPGNTIIWTQGAAGAAGTSGGGNGGNGGASSIASGTQTVATITANGSNGSLGATAGATTAGTAGGTGTGGSVVNQTGVSGGNGNLVSLGVDTRGYNIWKYQLVMGAAGRSTGGTAFAGFAGTAGLGIILWYQ